MTMEYRHLGKTGLIVSRYCFGSLTLGPLGADLMPEQGSSLLLKAFRAGIIFVDTAEYYRNYAHIRLALEQFDDADNIVIASKTLVPDDRSAAFAIEEARLGLNREVLDLFLLHEIRNWSDFQNRSGAWQVLLNAKANGIVKSIGISTHSAAVAARAALEPDVDVIHCMLNFAGVGILDGGVEDMLSAIADAKANGKGVYTMKAIGGGSLMKQARKALLWAFSQELPDAVAVGCKDEAELLTNLGWLRGEDPPQAEKCSKLPRRLVFDDCQKCGACVARCANGALTIDEDGIRWHNDKCLYCGYCVAACPGFCISFA